MCNAWSGEKLKSSMFFSSIKSLRHSLCVIAAWELKASKFFWMRNVADNLHDPCADVVYMVTLFPLFFIESSINWICSMFSYWIQSYLLNRLKTIIDIHCCSCRFVRACLSLPSLSLNTRRAPPCCRYYPLLPFWQLVLEASSTSFLQLNY